MIPLTDKTIRAAFVNVSQRERAAIPLPPDLPDTPWESIDYLGWRDPKLARVGYVVALVDGRAVGVLLRFGEQRSRARAQCAWCEDVTLPNDVVLYVARRAGRAGRAGDTIGTLVCEGFECSRNVRRLPPPAYLGYDVEAARDRRIEALRAHATAFVGEVASTA